MRSSEATRRWAAEFAASTQAESAPRNNSRIISAERLAGYVPFAMAELGRERSASFADARGTPQGPGSRAPSPFRQFGDKLEADPVDRSGFEAGYKAGLAAGFANGQQHGSSAALASAAASQRETEEQAGATLAIRIDALSDALEARFAQIEREAADDVVKLALEVARQVVRSTLAVRPEAVLAIVQEALAGLFEDRARMRLHLHAGDAELIRRTLDERPDTQSWEIVVDSSIDAGGCRIETPRAEIDATLETRWQRTLAAIGRNSDASLAGAAEMIE